MIKLIATDMDGTFLDSDKRFDPEFIDIFYKLKEKGIKFVIASGNQYYRLYQKFLPSSMILYIPKRLQTRYENTTTKRALRMGGRLGE